MVRTYLVSLLAIIIAASCMQVTSSALMTFVPLYVGAQGGDTFEVGLIAAAYSLGFMVGCLRGLKIINRVGYIRAFAAGAGLTAIMIIFARMTDSLVAWAALRFIMGGAIAMLFSAADAWLSVATPDNVRGRILSINSLAIGVMAILSQVLLFHFSDDPLLMLDVMLLLSVCSIVLLCLTRSVPPVTGDKAKLSFGQVFKEVPVALLGAFVAGAITTSFLTVVPFALNDAGVAAGTTAFLVALLYVGRLIFQWPMGALSDMMDRRFLILLCAIVICVLCALYLITDPFKNWQTIGDTDDNLFLILSILLVVIGGLSFPLYSLCLAHGFEFKVDNGPALSTYLLFVWALGSVFGPLAISAMSPVLPDRAAPVLTVVLSGLLALFTAWRLYRRPSRKPVLELSYTSYPSSGLGLSPETVANALENASPARHTLGKAQ
ncbi:MFS transporter [Pseudovibrio exalbescens]|uniref:MFS transporter n=1 Tax=Pseudovibrio exalbescens TaxID=197461 RepID=UPI0023657A86|nr:MFS transporter [Pseudovibrio exalbescens]MDD7908978.1 MFS transporter [Pseudovibrio exalbescens]